MDPTEPVTLETDIKAAIELYLTQIAALQDVISSDPDNQKEAEMLCEQLQEALEEARASLRAASRLGMDLAGPYATTASAATACMDMGGEEDGDECTSKPSGLNEADPAVEHGPEAQSSGRGGRKNNARMHPNNRYYREEPDFAALSKSNPELKPYVTLGPDGRAHFDFTSWEGTRQLTSTLLKHDFNIKWWLPEGQLVPTLTNRANYIHWLHDLLLLSSPEGPAQVRGLDIGCGASFIYCLLGAGIYGWQMVGCDITSVALKWSRRHIQANPHLSSLLEVRDSRRGAKQMAEVARQSSVERLPVELIRLPSAEGEGDAGGLESEGHRRPAVRRTLDGQPKGDALLDAGEEEAGPSALPKASAVTMSGLGEAASASGDEAEGGLLPYPPVGGANERSGSASAAAAGRVLAEALPSMAIAERAGAASEELKEAGAAPIRLGSPPGNGCTDAGGRAGAELLPPRLEMRGGEAGSQAEGLVPALLRSESNQLQRAASSEGEDEGQPGGDEGDGDGILLAAMRGDSESFAFCMCNPPFFSSMAEAESNPNTACGGTAAEMVFPGGELAFVMHIVKESVRLGARVHWYSTMVGKKTTLKALRKELHSRHVTAIRTTEFAQGKTSRWAIAWSFEVDPNLANQPLPRAANVALATPVRPKRLVSFTLQGGQDGRKLLKAMEAALVAHGATGAAVDMGMWSLTAALPSPDDGDAAVAAGGAAAQKRQRHPTAGALTREGGAMLRINMYQQQRGRFDVMATIAKGTSDVEALLFTSLMQKLQDDITAMWS